jgi:DNA-directed RNA polymerase subunit RPC12/RpoP
LISSYELAQRGEIVSTKSALAFDEDVICKRCGRIFSLAESNWVGSHPRYKKVKLHGMQCPYCKNVNVTYAKTPKLREMELRIDKAEFVRRKKLRAKYQREFTKAQRKYLNGDVRFSEEEKVN